MIFVADTVGTRTSCRAHQWIVDLGTPERAAARSAVYAPTASMGCQQRSIVDDLRVADRCARSLALARFSATRSDRQAATRGGARPPVEPSRERTSLVT